MLTAFIYLFSFKALCLFIGALWPPAHLALLYVMFYCVDFVTFPCGDLDGSGEFLDCNYS